MRLSFPTVLVEWFHLYAKFFSTEVKYFIIDVNMLWPNASVICLSKYNRIRNRLIKMIDIATIYILLPTFIMFFLYISYSKIKFSFKNSDFFGRIFFLIIFFSWKFIVLFFFCVWRIFLLKFFFSIEIFFVNIYSWYMKCGFYLRLVFTCGITG